MSVSLESHTTSIICPGPLSVCLCTSDGTHDRRERDAGKEAELSGSMNVSGTDLCHDMGSRSGSRLELSAELGNFNKNRELNQKFSPNVDSNLNYDAGSAAPAHSPRRPIVRRRDAPAPKRMHRSMEIVAFV
ncbi:hypothetical protein EVAR_101898_1 [Eumeta japonica]|uniref:Uncharacterized protein n=1 Tax=Eumeta variegata TaxID=151549 RepID=A0A4C1SNP0_EUMVA|nr:hypothetical protein EVAR_101898_1 [Eumeta japonica]